MCRSAARVLGTLVLAYMALAGACAPQPQEPPKPPTPSAVTSPAERSPAPRTGAEAIARPDATRSVGPWDVDLERDEQRGGHTLARHVGRTDEQLTARLRRESISAASTYVDIDTAERIVARTLDENSQRVKTWVARRAPKPNLAIRYRARDRLPTGRVLERGETKSRDVFGSVVVQRWRGEDWYVLTSYPEIVR
jgi:hypothetical protein